MIIFILSRSIDHVFIMWRTLKQSLSGGQSAYDGLRMRDAETGRARGVSQTLAFLPSTQFSKYAVLRRATVKWNY